MIHHAQGNEETELSFTKVPLPEDAIVERISAGGAHSCVVVARKHS